MLRWNIRRCPRCKVYTLKTLCPKCGSQTEIAHPHRFSPEDRYVKYRILMKITSGVLDLPPGILERLITREHS